VPQKNEPPMVGFSKNITPASPPPARVSHAGCGHVHAALERCPSLTSKRVSPHVLRHSAAMELLLADLDCSVIAPCLDHPSRPADLPARLPRIQGRRPGEAEAAQHAKRTHFRPNDQLLAFLEAL
jgi:hypothetical protein